jgi:hypothetical protein
MYRAYEEVIITRHGKAAGILIGFASGRSVPAQSAVDPIERGR